MSEIYKVNNVPAIEKIRMYDENKDTYYRFQENYLEMGTQSWGMIYSTPEEAIEDGSTVLNGKSCCSTAKLLHGFRLEFSADVRVLVLSGDFVEVGHDNEDVVNVAEILEIWDYTEFCNMVRDIKNGMYDEEEEEE